VAIAGGLTAALASTAGASATKDPNTPEPSATPRPAVASPRRTRPATHDLAVADEVMVMRNGAVCEAGRSNKC